MQRLLAEERKKISAVVGYKRKLPLADDWQQLQSFRPPRLKQLTLIGHVACGVRHLHQGCVQTFIDQEFQCRPASERR